MVLPLRSMILCLPVFRRALAWLVGCLLMLAAPGAMAGESQALELRDDTRVHDIWPHLSVMEDPSGALTLDQVLADRRGFGPPTVHYANFGLRAGAIWMLAPVKVPADQSGRWILDIDYPSIDRADIYLLHEGRVVQRVRLGDTLPQAQRPLATRSHAVPLALTPGLDQHLLIRVQTASSMIVPIRFYKSDAYYAREASTQALQALLAGIWVCLCLYSLTQWLVLRDLMFGYYAMTILGTGMFFASYFGMGPQHLWGGSDWLTQNTAPLAVLIGLTGGLLFVDRTLDVPQISRRAALVVRVLAVASGTSALVFVLGLISYRTAHTIATVLGLSPMLLAVPVAYLRWRAGDRAAAYMLWGWLIYAIGAGHQALLLRGLLDVTFWTQHAFQFGSMAEMALWMMVLGARIDEIRAKAEAAHRERDRLHSLAHTDALTGLLNRRGLQGAIEGVLRSTTPAKATAIYLLDLDGFKPVNDTLGHDAGDELLRQVGDRLKAQLRASDLVARLGGDEFVVAVSGLPDDADADAVGRKLLHAFQEPFEVMGQPCRVGLTIGYAMSPQDGRDVQGLLKRADAAMYAGKQAGKGRVQRGAASAGLVAG